MASYAASTLYHLLRDRRIGQHFQTLDHCFIYTHIAGTTTAPAILALYDHQGLLLAVLSWTLAIAGIVIRVFFFKKLHAISPLFYLTVGFIIFAWSRPIIDVMGVGALLLIAGGIAMSFYVIVGHWSDKVGRKKPIIIGAAQGATSNSDALGVDENQSSRNTCGV